MVIVIPNTKGEVDFIILTSINYALAQVGEPVVEFTREMNLKGEKQICISGHGGVGTIEYIPAKSFADVLADPVRGCKDSLQRLIFTCCHAGRRAGGKVGTSVIDVFANTLRIKDLKISGAMGPSIKANVLGEAYSVINQSAKSRSGLTGGDIQRDELKKTGNEKLANMATGDQRKMAWSKIKKKHDRGIIKEEMPYIQYKTDKYAKMSGVFYKNFVGRLAGEGLLLDAGHSMHTVHWDGNKIVDESSGDWRCYITSATVSSMNLPDNCDELNTLRWFRDHVMMCSDQGRREISNYYQTAPQIVTAINQRPDANQIYQEIFYRHITPSVSAIINGRHHDAYAIYKSMVSETWNRFIGH